MSNIMNQLPPGKQINDARKKLNLTQAELADRCKVDIRTIQRIESGDVTPRFYTLRIINSVLGTNIVTQNASDCGDGEVKRYRAIYARRKRFRIATFFSALFLLIAVALLAFPSWVLFGMQKHVWAPFLYVAMFAHIIGIALTWRCPACNSLLGDVFSTKYCSKCGLKLVD